MLKFRYEWGFSFSLWFRLTSLDAGTLTLFATGMFAKKKKKKKKMNVKMKNKQNIGSGAGIRLLRTSSATIRFCAGGSCVDTSNFATFNEWHHVAGAFDKYNKLKENEGPRRFIMLDNAFDYTTIDSNEFIEDLPFFFVGKWKTWGGQKKLIVLKKKKKCEFWQ
jgi:hypothetical protein